MTNTCPLCGCSRMSVQIPGLEDDRYGHPGTFVLWRCAGCGHRNLAAHFSDRELEELYTAFYPRKTAEASSLKTPVESRGWRGWMDGDRASAFRWVPRNVRVLDIGCGFGLALAYHQARGCEAWGIEADSNAIQWAKRFGHNAQHGVFSPALFPQGYFDYVTMDQVVEHLRNPVETFDGVSRVLRPGGHVVLSTPNASGAVAHLLQQRWVNWHAPYHLQFFSRLSLAHLARRTGFVVEDIRTVTPSSWLLLQGDHLLGSGQAGLPGPAWKRTPGWERVLGTRRAFLARWNLRLYERRFHDVMARVLDGFNAGDNFLARLRKA